MLIKIQLVLDTAGTFSFFLWSLRLSLLSCNRREMYCIVMAIIMMIILNIYMIVIIIIIIIIITIIDTIIDIIVVIAVIFIIIIIIIIIIIVCIFIARANKTIGISDLFFPLALSN